MDTKPKIKITHNRAGTLWASLPLISWGYDRAYRSFVLLDVVEVDMDMEGKGRIYRDPIEGDDIAYQWANENVIRWLHTGRWYEMDAQNHSDACFVL